MGPMGQNEARHYIRNKLAKWQYHLDVRNGLFSRLDQNAARGSKSAMNSWVVCLQCGDVTESRCATAAVAAMT